MCMTTKSKARIYHQRAADHQQRTGCVYSREDLVYRIPRHGIAEENHIGFEHAATARAGRHHKIGNDLIGYVGIAVWREFPWAWQS